MADNKLLQQMLESLVNDDQAKAEELQSADATGRLYRVDSSI